MTVKRDFVVCSVSDNVGSSHRRYANMVVEDSDIVI